MSATPYILLSFFLAIGLDLWLMDLLRKQQRVNQHPSTPHNFIFMSATHTEPLPAPNPEPILPPAPTAPGGSSTGWLKQRALSFKPTGSISTALQRLKISNWQSPVLELAWVVFFAVFAARWLLPAPPLDQVITWQEGPVVTHDLYQWVQIQTCGLCGLWNGGINGGAPTFVDLLTPLLHPVVVLLTLFSGPTHGSALVAVSAVILGGVSTWWLAKVTGLGRFARLWAGTLGAVAGGLVGKMDSYNMMLMFSQASAWLAIPPLVMLGWQKDQRAVGWLGLTAGLLLLSGQGYYQVGYFICILPAAFFLFGYQNSGAQNNFKKNLLVGVLLGVLIAGVLLVPFLHFSPNFLKPTDTALQNFQPLETLPLSLVIRDLDFFRQPLLGHDIMFYVNFNYIGWVPVLLALAAALLVPARDRRLMIFYFISILLLFLLISKEFANIIKPIYPGIDQFRYPASISGLTLPLIIVLAAWSLDRLFKIPRPEITLKFASGKQISFSLGLLAALPALLAITPNLELAHYWLDSRGKTSSPNIELLAAITPDKTAWLRPPASLDLLNFFYQKNIKITETYHSWTWRNRDAPQAEWYVETRDINPYPQYVRSSYFDLDIDQIPERAYAAVYSPEGQRECITSAVGGFIDAICNTEQTGMLEIKENSWQGWWVWVDGVPADLLPGRWLAVNVPAGKHYIQFRYYPVDIWLGLGISLIGLIWAFKIILTDPKQSLITEASSQTPSAHQTTIEASDDHVI